jgi:hypothetical protein
MFYLKTYFSLLFKSGLRGYALLATLMCFSIICQSQKQGEKILKSLSLQSYLNPYMTLFVDPGHMPQGLAQRIKLFGFVKEVQKIDVDEGMGQWWQTIKDLNLSSQWKNQKPMGVRVIFNQSINAQDKNELLELLDLKIGQEHLTASSVTYPKGQTFLKMHPLFKYLSRFGIWGVIAPLMILIVVLLILIQPTLNQELYMIGRFQRRSWVKSKVIGAGMLTVFLVGTGFSYFTDSFDMKGSFIAFAVLMFIWSLSFKPLSWKWNS